MVLALDYGDARIGVARTDASGEHALAHGVIAGKPRQHALAALQALAREVGAVRFVLGLPVTLGGTEGPQAASVRGFGEALAAATRLPVEFVDERYTTRAAEAAARIKGTDPDAEAARLILEAWLARSRTT